MYHNFTYCWHDYGIVHFNDKLCSCKTLIYPQNESQEDKQNKLVVYCRLCSCNAEHELEITEQCFSKPVQTRASRALCELQRGNGRKQSLLRFAGKTWKTRLASTALKAAEGVVSISRYIALMGPTSKALAHPVVVVPTLCPL